MRVLLDAGLAAARDNGVTSKKVIAAGYCFGGAAVLEMADPVPTCLPTSLFMAV